MTSEWGYPRGLIAVEKGESTRRYDVVCYSNTMAPLLLIECKATPLDDAAAQQALGYNAVLKAPFICLASPTEIKTFWHERGQIASVPFLPIYAELHAISQRL